jgi:hypothetical protein
MILRARYGDRNRTIQEQVDNLEHITPITKAFPQAFNTMFIQCNRSIQALQALGTDAYGRVLAPKIIPAFPDDILRRWIGEEGTALRE